MASAHPGVAMLPVEGCILAVVGIDHTLGSARLRPSLPPRSARTFAGSGLGALFALGQSLAPLLEMRDIRRKLGLTQAQLATKLHGAVATCAIGSTAATRPIPPCRLLRVLDKLPELALCTLDEPPRRAE